MGEAGGINVWSGHNYALEVVRHLGLERRGRGRARIGLGALPNTDNRGGKKGSSVPT